jgi:hypothetical protein
MNWKLLPEARCKYIHVRSTAASMRQSASGNSFQPMSLTVHGSAMNFRIINPETVCCVFTRLVNS